MTVKATIPEVKRILEEVGKRNGLPQGFTFNQAKGSDNLRIDFEAITKTASQGGQSIGETTKVAVLYEGRQELLKAFGFAPEACETLTSQKVNRDSTLYKNGAYQPWPRIVLNLEGKPAFPKANNPKDSGSSAQVNELVDQLKRDRLYGRREHLETMLAMAPQNPLAEKWTQEYTSLSAEIEALESKGKPAAAAAAAAPVATTTEAPVYVDPDASTEVDDSAFEPEQTDPAAS